MKSKYRDKVQKICKGCKKSFAVYYSHFNRHDYCSLQCKIESTNLNIYPHKYNGKTYYEIKISPHKRQKYHRYIMEQYLGRKLVTNELVHHIDGNPSNNDIKNLKIVTRTEHRKEHKQIIEKTCLWCKKIFIADPTNHSIKRRKARKFCSLSCTSKYGNSLRKKT